jgi:hypothetical protein
MEMRVIIHMNAKETQIWFAHLTNVDVQMQMLSIGMEHIVVMRLVIFLFSNKLFILCL